MSYVLGIDVGPPARPRPSRGRARTTSSPSTSATAGAASHRAAPRRRRQPGRRRGGRAVGRRRARAGRPRVPGPDRRRRPDAAGGRAVGAGGADGVAGALGRGPGRRARGRPGGRDRGHAPRHLGRRPHRAAGRRAGRAGPRRHLPDRRRAPPSGTPGRRRTTRRTSPRPRRAAPRSPCWPATSRRSAPTTSPHAWPRSPGSRGCRRPGRTATRTTARPPRCPHRAPTTRAAGRPAAPRPDDGDGAGPSRRVAGDGRGAGRPAAGSTARGAHAATRRVEESGRPRRLASTTSRADEDLRPRSGRSEQATRGAERRRVDPVDDARATDDLLAALGGFTGTLGATNTAGLLSGYTPPSGLALSATGSRATALIVETDEPLALPPQRNGSGRWVAVRTTRRPTSASRTRRRHRPSSGSAARPRWSASAGPRRRWPWCRRCSSGRRRARRTARSAGPRPWFPRSPRPPDRPRSSRRPRHSRPPTGRGRRRSHPAGRRALAVGRGDDAHPDRVGGSECVRDDLHATVGVGIDRTPVDHHDDQEAGGRLRHASGRSGSGGRTARYAHRYAQCRHARRARSGFRNGPFRSSPDGIRTRATALRGRRPRPLDDGAAAVHVCREH